MLELIKFEWKKMNTHQIGFVSILLLIGFSLLLSLTTYQSRHAFDGIDKEGTGQSAILIEQQVSNKYQGMLTDEKVEQVISDFKPTIDLKGSHAKYIYQNAIQSSVFARFVNENGSWNGKKVSDVFGANKILIGDNYGWLQTSQNLVKVLFLLSFVLVVLISRVFSMEYSGMDALILTCYEGKRKVATSKIITSLLMAFLFLGIVVVFNFSIGVLLYGTTGMNTSILMAPIEFTEGYIPFNMTVRTLLFYQSLLAFFSILGIVGLSLVISSLSKNTMIAILLGIVFLYGPFIIPISELSPLYSVFTLFPIYLIQFISLMSIEQYSDVLYYSLFAIPMALLIFLIGIKLSFTFFTNREVL